MRYAILARLVLDAVIAITAATQGRFAVAWLFVGLVVADAATMFL